ncbi:MAG: hypothetical protein AAGI06_09180 [Pseudomonadota bacterium]
MASRDKAAKPRAKMGVPKIQGFIAQNANTMVLLYRRRGKETFVVRYTYADKTGGARHKLSVGSRFTGRFYPSRCSQSPDGKHFINFVMGGRQAGYKEQHYCWTAMCRPPDLKALFFLPHNDTWGGGGLFLNNRTVVVDGCMYDDKAAMERLNLSSVDGVNVIVQSGYVPLPEPAKWPKPVDTGWRPSGMLSHMQLSTVRKKTAKRANLVARAREAKSFPGYYDLWEYTLLGRTGRTSFLDDVMKQATWADFDRQGRLVVAIGHTLQIYKSPREGMSEKPTRIIDLEEATAPA